MYRENVHEVNEFYCRFTIDGLLYSYPTYYGVVDVIEEREWALYPPRGLSKCFTTGI